MFDRRRFAYLKAIEEIEARPEWAPLAPIPTDAEEEKAKKRIMANTMLAALLVRFGSDEDRDDVKQWENAWKG